MAKVITFSTVFPKGHIREGETTGFPTYIALCLFSKEMGMEVKGKLHTIRSGKRWKLGDKFSPRIWTGKPYNSKQEVICEDLEIKDLYDIEIKENGDIWINNNLFGQRNSPNEKVLAKNDGLLQADFQSWFSKLPFSGQIICWNKMDYESMCVKIKQEELYK